MQQEHRAAVLLHRAATPDDEVIAIFAKSWSCPPRYIEEPPLIHPATLPNVLARSARNVTAPHDQDYVRPLWKK